MVTLVTGHRSSLPTMVVCFCNILPGLEEENVKTGEKIIYQSHCHQAGCKQYSCRVPNLIHVFFPPASNAANLFI